MKVEQGAQAKDPVSPWRFILTLGVVSLLADMVYESARSVTGPLLASLGASGTVIGIVTGAGEATALGLRLLSGPLADRTRRFWALTISGYALTAITVPLLGLASVLWVACALVIGERVGKAIRAPAKDTLLSHATAVVGRGRGFAVHQAMDQCGAFLGPMAVACILAITDGDYRIALGVLCVPGALAVSLLVRLRVRVPDPAAYERGAVRRAQAGAPERLSKAFWMYATFTAVTTAGVATFGVLSYHLVAQHLVAAPIVPIVYAIAMLANAVAALATGWCYDRWGTKSLVLLPALTAVVPTLAFRPEVAAALAGVLVWGAVTGVQESTLRATVAGLVPTAGRATAYGMFAAVVGGASFIGGAVSGWLYDASVPALIIVVAVLQVVAVGLLLLTVRVGQARS